MVKLLFFSLIYCLCCFVWDCSCDVNEIGSSISAAVDSGPGIKDATNFSHHRAKRAFTLLVPVDNDELSDEHHKSKRCWRARPVQKVRLSLYPEDSDNRIYSATGSGQRIRSDGQNIEDGMQHLRGATNRNNLNDLYENRERSVDQSAEYSLNSDEMMDEKIAKLKLLPLKNPRDNLKEFFNSKTPETQGETSSNESEEDGEDVILRRIKDHLNSDDYNVLALVGKRTGNYPSNNRRKLICYCRDVNCSGGDCDRMMYRPCSTCGNPRPGFSGRPNNKFYSNYGRDYYKNQEMRLADERIPLNVRYPVTKNQFVDYPMNKNDLQPKKSQELTEKNRIGDRGGQFFHDTPRIVLANPNNGMNQYRILHIPVSSKSPMENGISGSSRPAGIYPPASGRPLTNQYRSGTVRFGPNPPAYNRWAMNPYYLSIGNSGSMVPSANQGIVRVRPPGSQPNPFLGASQPKMMTEPHSTANDAFYGRYGLRWNTPSGMRPEAFSQQQNIRVPFGKLDFQETTQTSMSSTPLEDDEGESVKGHFEAGDYDARKEYNFGSSGNLERNSYNDYSDESMENNPTVADYGYDNERKGYLNMIENGGSLRGNVEHIEDQRNLDYTGVTDEPQKYKFPVIFTESDDSEGKNELPEISGGSSTLEPKEFYKSKNEYPIPGIVGMKQASNNEDRESYSIGGTTTTNEQSYWNGQNLGATTQRIIQTGNDEDSYSDDTGTIDSEDEELVGAEEEYGSKSTSEDYSDIQVITNGYFSSETYEDFGKINYEAGPTTEMHRSADHSLSIEEESNTAETTDTQIESGLLNENVATTPDAANIEDGTISQLSAPEVIDEPSIKPQADDLRNIINTGNGETSSSEDLSSHGVETGSKIQQTGFDKHDDNVVDATTSSNYDSGLDSGNLEASSERDYSSIESGESRTSSPGSTKMESDEIIESSKNPESSSTEVVGNQHADSEGYDSLTSEENYTYVTYEEEDDVTPSLPVSVEDASGSLLNPGKILNKNLKEDSEVPAEGLVAAKNNDEAHGKYWTIVDQEPGDIVIENSATKYFSPNDRVLEYIKKHSQNLVRDPGDNFYQRNTETFEYVTPEIYHTKLREGDSAEPEFQGSESGSSSAGDKTLTQPFDCYESHDSGAQTDLEDNSNQEEDTFVHGREYGDENNTRSSDGFERESTALGKPGDENPAGKRRGYQRTVDDSVSEEKMKLSKDYVGSDYDYHAQYSPNQDYGERYSPEVGINNGDEPSSELLLTSVHEEKPTGNKISKISDDQQTNLGNPVLSETERLAEIPPENDRAKNDQETSAEGLLRIQHLGNSGYETTEMSVEYETVEDSRETISRDFEENKKFVTADTNEEDYGTSESTEELIATQNLMHPSTYHYDSTEASEGSVLVGNPQGLSTEKLGIIHTQKQQLPLDNDYADYTEESSIDYSTEKSSTDEYRQYSERDNEESVVVRSTTCSQQATNDRKSATESYGNSKKILMGKFPDSVSEEDVDQTNTHEGEIASTESQESYGISNSKENAMNTLERINTGEETGLNQYVGFQNPEYQSETNNWRPGDVADQISQQDDKFQDLSTSNSSEDASRFDADEEDNYTSQSQIYSTEKTTKDVNEKSKLYSTQQLTQNVDNLSSTNLRDGSSLVVQSKNHVEENLTPVEEEMKSIEFVGGSRSIAGCCTKPPEVGDDLGYLGRLAPKNRNADVKSLGDLVDSDLFYIGDGVRLPLTIKRLKDGSFALSISDKICRQRSNEKCRCCVPREGKILQEKHGGNNPEEESNLRRRAIPESHQGMEEEELNDVQETQHHSKRSTRSITMPVDEFAEKYNLILNLEDRVLDDYESPLTRNVIQRDEEGQESGKDTSDLVQRLKSMKELPENEKADVLLSTLKEIIGTEQTEVLDKKLRDFKSRGESVVDNDDDNAEEDESGVLKFRYTYQRDNPILDRIKMIKKLQKEMYRCDHRYQKDCDDAITQKTELLTMILYWLKDLASSKPTQSPYP